MTSVHIWRIHRGHSGGDFGPRRKDVVGWRRASLCRVEQNQSFENDRGKHLSTRLPT
jgi:hypothetical protein